MGFFREGWRELGRKWERNKLRGQQRRQEAERLQALTRLGQRAWEAKVDLAGFPELSAQLRQLETRSGELSATTKSLESERATLEEKRRAEVARFDNDRRGVEEKKRPVDEALRAARQRQAEQEQAVRRLENRLAALPKELAGLEQQLAALTASAAPDRAAKAAAAETRRQQLQAEQAQATAQLPKAKEPLPGLLAEAGRLQEESQRYTAEMNRIENERRTALAAVEAELNRVRGQLSTTASETGTVEKERSERFTQLGLGLYEQKVAQPALADGQKVVAAIDQERAASRAALEASLAQTQLMPGGTMLKFAAVLLLVPLLLVGAGVGGYLGWTWWSERQQGQEVEVNPYLFHPLSDHPAYVLANSLAEAGSEEEAAGRLLDLCRVLHLGVYTGDGQRILAGAERSDKDFFLYDFQRKILARALVRRSVTSFADQSYIFGRAFLGLNSPEQLEPWLTEAVARRYQEASQNSGDPANFLILVVDGLARHQVRPYSLDELRNRPHEELYLDPVQSFLLMLDFFVGSSHPAPATPTARYRLSLPWPALPTVRADSPCDDILGEGGQEAWGRGVDVAGDVMEQAGELAGREGLERFGNAFGTTMDGLQAAGDLLLLYAINITLTPTPKQYVHLPPSGFDQTAIDANVTFEPQGVPDEALGCGWLAGKKLPPSGPMKDVELYWDFEPMLAPDFRAATEISWHTETPGVKLEHIHEGFRTKTDENGWSMFPLVTIRNCQNHRGGGKVVGRRYNVTVSARVVTQDIPTPGLLGALGLVLKLGPGALEYLMRGRSGYTWIQAEWHEKKPKEKQY